jgi:hypothetical protein
MDKTGHFFSVTNCFSQQDSLEGRLGKHSGARRVGHMAGVIARKIGRWPSVQQRTGITVLSYKAASNPNMATPRPTPAPAASWGAAPVLPGADAEVREALPVTCVTAELPAERVPLLEGVPLLDGFALLDRVALPDGHEGWVLTLIF